MMCEIVLGGRKYVLVDPGLTTPKRDPRADIAREIVWTPRPKPYAKKKAHR